MSVKTKLRMKVLLLGASQVGKTSLIHRYVEGASANIEDNSSTQLRHLRTLECSDGHKCIQQEIWDTAGQEKYQSLAPMYFRDLDAAVLVYSVDDKKSFDNLPFWLNEVKEKAPPGCIIGIAGNKIDRCGEERVSCMDALQFASSHNFLLWQTSAKTGFSVTEMFSVLAEKQFPNSLSLGTLSRPPTQSEIDVLGFSKRGSFRLSRLSFLEHRKSKCKC